MADQYIGLQVDQLFREGLNSLRICTAPAIIDPDVVACLPTEFLKVLLKYGDARTSIGIAFGDRHQHADPPRPPRLLRAGDDRPRHHAADKGNKFSPPHGRPRAEDHLISIAGLATSQPNCFWSQIFSCLLPQT